MREISASAPGKLMLFGEHAVVYHRPCLVTAVDQRIRVRITENPSASVEITAPDVGVEGYQIELKDLNNQKGVNDTPVGVRFVRQGVVTFSREKGLGKGLRIETTSEFSSSFGFGSSPAVTVALIKGLSEMFGVKMGKREIFDLAHKAVLEVQGTGSGFDLAAAVWGGTLYFTTGGKEVIPLSTDELPLVVGYTGIKADTPTLVRQVSNLRKECPEIVEGTFDLIATIVEEARKNLEENNLPQLGRLMNLNQGLLKLLGVETEELSRLVFAANSAGAFGAKLSGAGGGDCMIALVPLDKKEAVTQSIEKRGGEVIPIRTGAPGVKLEG